MPSEKAVIKVPFNDLAAQYATIKQDIDSAIASVIAESAFIRGPHVELFEERWKETLGVGHCISCGNGTDALYIAMRALKIRPGDEVITTAHSWISTSEAITQAGGRVVFCDTDASTFTIDPRSIQERISARTVGIVPVHLFGQPADMGAIMMLARKHKLWVIEDCAQAHLARYEGRFVGTFGDAATFSFYPGKNLGAYGDAGCVVTNDSGLADFMAYFARHGGKGDHLMEGINSRMDGLQAAVLNVKMPHLPGWTTTRQMIAARYNEMLKDVGDIVIPAKARGREHVYHQYVILTGHRDALRERLSNAGIETMLYYPKALPFYPAYSYLGHKLADFPVAFNHQTRLLALPIYPEISESQMDYVAHQIRLSFAQ